MIGQIVGKYRVRRQIGEGGMGAVYEAVHEGIGERVAIKVLRPLLSAQPDLVNRFFNEARAVNIVQHPGLVKISDFGILPNGTAYLIMEYLEGESLQARIGRLNGALTQADALRLLRQVASALVATHQNGIVHRDLKPDNIFIVRDPELPSGERAKLLDFGVAKVRAADGDPAWANHTTQGAMLGTPLYMSPEQCNGAQGVDDKSDVYSLGVILYQMLCGRTPFVGPGPGALIVQHLTMAPPPIRQLARGVPEPLCALVERMMHKKPAERPTMQRVLTEVERLSGHFSGQISRVGKDDWSADLTEAMPLLDNLLFDSPSDDRPPPPTVPMPAMKLPPLPMPEMVMRPSTLATLKEATGQAQRTSKDRSSMGGLLVGLLLLGTVGWTVNERHRKAASAVAPAAPADRPAERAAERTTERTAQPAATPREEPPPKPVPAPTAPPLAAPARWRVISNPVGAEVLDAVDRSPLGKTAWETEEVPGGLTVIVHKQGYSDRRVVLDCPGNCTRSVKLDTIRKNSAPAPSAQRNRIGELPD